MAEHLGHSDVATTMGIYADVTKTDKRHAADRLQQAWDEAAELSSRSTNSPNPRYAERDDNPEAAPDNVVELRRVK